MSYASVPHLRGNAASIGQTVAPTKTNGAGAGTSPTITVSGSDEAGQVSITLGTSPAAGTLVTLTFQTAYAVAPVVVVSAVDTTTATVGSFYASATTTQVVIGTHGTPTSGTLKLNYVVVGGA